jgi:drug/metabolite transporter (DMT)-like permease
VKEAIYIALALLGWGSWTVLEKVALRSTTPMMLQLGGTYFYSAMAPVFFLLMKWRGDPMVWTRWGIFWIVVGGIIATVANCGFLFAIQAWPVHRVLSYTQLYPALSFVMCWLLLGETFTLQKILGAILMLVGCYVMNW